MLHCYFVGHFDPADRFDFCLGFRTLKTRRPILLADANQALDEFGRDVEPYILCREDGCVWCNWSDAPFSLWDRVLAFAFFLARRTGASVMDEQYAVLWPSPGDQGVQP